MSTHDRRRGRFEHAESRRNARVRDKTEATAASTASANAEDEDDAALFRNAIGPVRELPSAAPPPQAPKPRPAAKMAHRDDQDARSEFRRLLDSPLLLAGDALRYRRDEVPERILQRLGRGQYAAQDELDLHRCDAATAEVLLRRFLKEARDDGAGCVRIVHGKGLHADDGVPTLKNLVDRILRQRSDVLAFHSAPGAQGGTGAVLVLLAPSAR
ncbi:MAG: Smr/MutS family protein [Lysobacter sp.]|nr:Smr/MutS family protein [Lysobacter sp.]